MKITLGCDPEAFLVDAAGQLKSAIGRVGGSKEHPQHLDELGEGYCVQEDNVALEFNIPPAEGRSQFAASVGLTLKYLTSGIQAMYGFSLSTQSAACFPKEELLEPAALMFGCEPDYNAWTLAENPKPKAEDETLRSCGGHVHVGHGEGVDKAKVAQMMDLFLGVPSVLMDKGEKRKQLYGKAGACRFKPYGVEYRTLSNFWIFEDRLVEWVWDNTLRAVDAAGVPLALSEQDSNDIVSAINNNNKELAQQLVKKFNLEVVNV